MAEKENSRGYRIVIAPLSGGESRIITVSSFLFKTIITAIVLTAVTFISALFLWGTFIFTKAQNSQLKKELIRVSEQTARITLIEKNLVEMEKYVKYIRSAVSLTGDSVPPSLEQFSVNDSLKKKYESVADSLDYANIPNIVPVSKGWVSREFNEQEKHFGIDYTAPVGTPICATARGEVTDVHVDPELGNVIAIDHGNGFTTRFGHCLKITVPSGAMVNRGDTVALLGNSGKSTSGPHCYYEIIRDGSPADPRLYILKGLE